VRVPRGRGAFGSFFLGVGAGSVARVGKGALDCRRLTVDCNLWRGLGFGGEKAVAGATALQKGLGDGMKEAAQVGGGFFNILRRGFGLRYGAREE